MQHDIDLIIEQVRADFPSVGVVQHSPPHEADDDGLWWFRLPGVSRDIQIESSTYDCPFLIEHSDMRSTSDALTGHSVREVVVIVNAYLRNLERDHAEANSSNANGG